MLHPASLNHDILEGIFIYAPMGFLFFQTSSSKHKVDALRDLRQILHPKPSNSNCMSARLKVMFNPTRLDSKGTSASNHSCIKPAKASLLVAPLSILAYHNSIYRGFGAILAHSWRKEEKKAQGLQQIAFLRTSEIKQHSFCSWCLHARLGVLTTSQLPTR